MAFRLNPKHTSPKPKPRSPHSEPAVALLAAELEEARSSWRKAEEDLHWELAVGSTLRELYKPLISPDSTAEEMAQLVLTKARELTGSVTGYVSALDPQTGRLERHAATGGESGICGGMGKCRRATLDADLESGCFWSRSQPGGPRYFVNRKDSPLLCTCSDARPFSIERFLCIPVVVEGKAAGMIALANAPRDYTARDVKAVRHLARFYALALDRKKYQSSIINALREKEVLLREIHHRVKNNLQVISSLLNLQARALTDPEALEMLKESQNRVRSMAMVHEHLHRSRDLSKISFGEYVRNLCASLFSSYGIDSSRIALRIQVEELFFEIDTAIPCGLIIQELVSNSLKYAFPGKRSGEIRIDLRVDAGHRMVLTVADTGVGLPKSVDVANTNSLGLRLVRILVAQVDGVAECISNNGTIFTISFRQGQKAPDDGNNDTSCSEQPSR
jgi:two-component sensor histidine kinase